MSPASSGFHLPSCTDASCEGCAGKGPKGLPTKPITAIERAVIEEVCHYLETEYRADGEPLVVKLRRGDWRSRWKT